MKIELIGRDEQAGDCCVTVVYIYQCFQMYLFVVVNPILEVDCPRNK